jgi:hypothetical protein
VHERPLVIHRSDLPRPDPSQVQRRAMTEHLGDDHGRATDQLPIRLPVPTDQTVVASRREPPEQP